MSPDQSISPAPQNEAMFSQRKKRNMTMGLVGVGFGALAWLGVADTAIAADPTPTNTPRPLVPTFTPTPSRTPEATPIPMPITTTQIYERVPGSEISIVNPVIVEMDKPITTTSTSKEIAYAVQLKGPEGDTISMQAPSVITVNGEEAEVRLNGNRLEYVFSSGKLAALFGDQYFVNKTGIGNHFAFNRVDDGFMVVSTKNQTGGALDSEDETGELTLESEIREDGAYIETANMQAYLPKSFLDAFGVELSGFDFAVDKDGVIVVYGETKDSKTISIGEIENGVFQSNLTGTVDAQILNVRDNPNGKLLTTVKKGESFTIIGQAGNWYQIVRPDGTTGFVSANYVTREIQEAPQAEPAKQATRTPIPTATPTRTPTPTTVPPTATAQPATGEVVSPYKSLIEAIENEKTGVGTIKRINSSNLTNYTRDTLDTLNPNNAKLQQHLDSRISIISGENTHLGYTAEINKGTQKQLAQAIGVIMQGSAYNDFHIVLQLVSTVSSGNSHKLQSQVWSSFVDQTSKTILISLGPTGPGFTEEQWINTISDAPLFAIATERAYLENELPSQKSKTYLPGALVNEDMAYIVSLLDAARAGDPKKNADDIPQGGLQNFFIAHAP